MPSFWCCCDGSPPVVPGACAEFLAGTVPEYLQLDVPVPTWVDEAGGGDLTCRVGDNCSDQVLPVDVSNLNGSRVVAHTSGDFFSCTWRGWRNYCKADSSAVFVPDGVIRESVVIVVNTVSGSASFNLTATQSIGIVGSMLPGNSITWSASVAKPLVDVSGLDYLDDVSLPFFSQTSQPHLVLGELRDIYPVDIGAALAAHLYVSNGPETHTDPAVACSL